MRILIITDQFPPKYFGGMAQHAWHVSHFLVAKHNVKVLLPIECHEGQNGLPFDVMPKLSMRFPRVDAKQALKVAREFKPDIIHVCTAGLAFPSLARRYPIVARIVGNDFLRPWCGGNFLLRSLYYRIPSAKYCEHIRHREREMRKRRIIDQLRHCAVLVANTDWTKDRLVENGIPPKTIHVVSGGYDASMFTASEAKQRVRQTLGFLPNELILLVAANLVQDKAIDIMLKAVSRLVKDYPMVRYVVIGSGVEEQNLKTISSDLGLDSCVRFVGHKSQFELKDYYQAADIYVQASRVESMGRTYFEAGGCGIPVIASRVGGVPSVVEHGKNGLMVDDPEDVDELIDRITTLLDNPELRSSMGAEGIRLAREKFSWQSVGSAFEHQLQLAARVV